MEMAKEPQGAAATHARFLKMEQDAVNFNTIELRGHVPVQLKPEYSILSLEHSHVFHMSSQWQLKGAPKVDQF